MVFWVGIIFGFIIFVGFIIFALIRYNQEKIGKGLNLRPNSKLIEIESKLRRSFVDSYKRGIVEIELERPNGTTYFKFHPTDTEQGANVKRPTAKTLIVKSEYIKRQNDGRRIIITILPISNFDCPDELLNTHKGNFLTVEGQKAFLISQFGKLIPSGFAATSEAFKEISVSGIGKEALASIKESSEKHKKLIQQFTEVPYSKPEEKSKP